MAEKQGLIDGLGSLPPASEALSHKKLINHFLEIP
jgi:hypothetical protein